MLNAMRKAILLSLLTLMSSSAMAEWVTVGTSTIDTLYIDPASLRREENRARLWALNDFKVAQRFNEGEPFMSQKGQYEYDCRAQQWRLFYYSSHSGNMAEGEVVGYNIVPGAWESIPPGSGIEDLWKFACGKA